jgi:hypothetical protein
MTKWVVYQYEMVETTALQDELQTFMPGEVSSVARVVSADSEDAAILQMGCEGFFSAHPLVELRPRHVDLRISKLT